MSTLTSADEFTKAEIAALHAAAMYAESVWERELARLYGRQACNARYDARGTATPALARMNTMKHTTYSAFRLAAWPHARAA